MYGARRRSRRPRLEIGKVERLGSARAARHAHARSTAQRHVERATRARRKMLVVARASSAPSHLELPPPTVAALHLPSAASSCASSRSSARTSFRARGRARAVARRVRRVLGRHEHAAGSRARASRGRVARARARGGRLYDRRAAARSPPSARALRISSRGRRLCQRRERRRSPARAAASRGRDGRPRVTCPPQHAAERAERHPRAVRWPTTHSRGTRSRPAERNSSTLDEARGARLRAGIGTPSRCSHHATRPPGATIKTPRAQNVAPRAAAPPRRAVAAGGGRARVRTSRRARARLVRSRASALAPRERAVDGDATARSPPARAVRACPKGACPRSGSRCSACVIDLRAPEAARDYMGQNRSAGHPERHVALQQRHVDPPPSAVAARGVFFFGMPSAPPGIAGRASRVTCEPRAVARRRNRKKDTREIKAETP